jgi:putative ABC transport system substrate-binding protein
MSDPFQRGLSRYDALSEAMRRRDFISFLGAAASWPLAARAQQAERMRRIGVLLNLAENDPETKVRLNAFLQALQELGWSEGKNLQIDYRWGVGDPDRHRKNAAELVALAPDVILAHGSPIMRPLLRTTRSIPIVFVSVADPVAAGFVENLARPGGNATGFALFEYSISAKWLELLRQVSPTVTRAAVIRDPDQPSGGGQLGAIQAAAAVVRTELTPIDVRDKSEIERAITAFARRPNGGLIVTATALAQIHRSVILALAAQHRLPAIYPAGLYVNDGGLLSYGPDVPDQYRRAAGYVDRVLRGEKPSELPVQAPTKFELLINLKTAKTLGLTVPPALVARADQVIE